MMDYLSEVPSDLSLVNEPGDEDVAEYSIDPNDEDGVEELAPTRLALQVPPAFKSEEEECPPVFYKESAEESDPTIEVNDQSEEISEDQLDRLAELDFTMPDASESKDSLEQTELPDPEEEEEDTAPDIPMTSPYEESAQITAGGDKPLHKRSIPKVAIGVGFAILIASIGAMMSSGGSSTQTASEDIPPAAPEVPLPGSAPESDAGKLQAQLTSNGLATEINARQAAKEQQAKAAKEAADQARRDQMIGATTSPSAPATLPRISYPDRSTQAPTPNYNTPRSTPGISQNRVVPPRIPVQSQVPPVQPGAIAPPSAPAPEQEAPQMLAFGSMPNSGTELNDSQGFGVEPAMQDSNNPAFEQPTSTLVAQQEAFLTGRRQTQIKAGQTINAKIEGQYLAEPDTEFLVRTASEVLGLKAGSLLRAKVIGMSGKYIGAEIISMISPSGLESPVPPGAMTVSSASGKLLKASSNKGFFQSAVGKGLLGFGRGAADQFISRTESFSSNQFGSSFSRGAGSKDLTSVLGSGLRGFADPMLQNPNSGQSALTLNPGAVQLNINASFSIAQ